MAAPQQPTPTASPGELLQNALGRAVAPADDPAWQPPRDPLADVTIKAQAGAVTREIPLVTVATGWDVPSTRGALGDLVIGLFDRPAQLMDSIIGDSRCQSAMASRVGGLLGRPVDFLIPRKLKDSAEAQECRDAFVAAWPTMAAEPILGQLQRWAVMIGFGPSQILWNTGGKYAIPHPRPWHPRYTYYHWMYRCYVAITMDGQTPILPGDGHWILHAPHGEYRGWMEGAVRAVAPWWLARNYALRDWARYSERHGLPMIKAKTPAAGDPVQQALFRAQLANLGQETVFHLPQNVDARFSYDVELMEAQDSSWEGFKALIQACDMEITLALLAQNLTTEVKEGSYAAARVHADVRQALLEADARALSQTIYTQLARPFAAMNFGDPDLAPRVVWDVRPYEDGLTAVRTFLDFATAIKTLREAGYELGDAQRAAKDFGLELGSLRSVVKGSELYQYDLELGVATFNEARERKGLPRRDGGDETVPERMARLGLGADEREEARFLAPTLGRIATPRLRVSADDDALREAFAAAEFEMDRRDRRARRKRA